MMNSPGRDSVKAVGTVPGDRVPGLVERAQAGERAALDELIAGHLQLVYNIVGRALAGHPDTDDVVQETLLQVVSGLGGLRDPASFRSWTVAIAMNQIRRRWRDGPSVRELADDRPPVAPGSDFAELAIVRLGLSDQRRETVEATRWLDPDDRELLALWWLEAAGNLTRADLAAALELPSQHVAVKVQRMKEQLETARVVVRALRSRASCPALSALTADWDEVPSALWRKRLARHARVCDACSRQREGLVPAEGLLAGLAMVPVPSGYGPLGPGAPVGHIGLVGQVGQVGTVGSRARHSASRRRGSRGGGHRRARPRWPMVAAATGVAAAAVVGVFAVAQSPEHQQAVTAAAAISSSSRTVTIPAPASASPTTAPSPTHASARPSSARPAPARPRPTPAAPTTPAASTASSASSAPAASASGPSLAVQQVLALINQARAGQGLAPLTLTSGLDASAAQHDATMDDGCGLSHQCPGEAALGQRETDAGVNWTACGENIGDGGPVDDDASAEASMAVGLTQSMLDEKPPNDGHRLNILSTSYTHIGIAVIRDSSTGTVWLTQDFSD